MSTINVNLRLSRSDFDLNVDLTLPNRGVTVFYGHSGSGKTTLLRCIAGLEEKAKGKVIFNNEVWQDEESFTPTHRRPLGYVFQEASLFPHLNGQQNIDFAIKRAARSQQKISVSQAIELLGIEKILQRYPGQMSGGERQRVAIARALLVNPDLLLMDEPLASLDLERKQEILPYLEQLKHELDLPIFYVSHSPDEVARLADSLVVLKDGEVTAEGSLFDLLSSLDLPIKLDEDAGVVIEGEITERDLQWKLAKISISCGDLWFRDYGLPIGETVRIRILARDISLALEEQKSSSITNHFSAEVIELKPDYHEGLMLVKLAANDNTLIARVTSRSAHNLKLEPGKKLWAYIKSVAIVQ